MQADELAADMTSVAAQWEALIDQAEEARPPCSCTKIWARLNAPCATLYAAVLKLFALKAKRVPRRPAYCRQHSPDPADRIEKSDDDEYLFDRHNIDEYIEEAQSARVELPSGGWVIFVHASHDND